MKTCIAISYPGDHRKDGLTLEGWEHADMLERTVHYARGEMGQGCPIIICAIGFSGLLPWKRRYDPRELNAYWRLFTDTLWATIPENPGFEDGATFAIGQALYAAHNLGCDYLIKMNEDCIPHKGVLKTLVDRMEKEGLEYIGSRWGKKFPLELSPEFFVCSVPYFAYNFGPYGDGVNLGGRYLAELMEGRPYSLIPKCYECPRSHSEYLALMEKNP